MSRRAWTTGVAVFVCCWSVARGADSGRTGGLTLLRSVAARPSALGEAYAGVSGDIDAMPINPASLATLPNPAYRISKSNLVAPVHERILSTLDADMGARD